MAQYGCGKFRGNKLGSGEGGIQYITNPRTCAFRGLRGAAGAFRFLPPVVAPCNLKKMQTLAKERSRIDNIRKVVRRREHTGLEAGRDASGPAAEVEDAHGAVAVARLDEPPRFPMDGFVGGGLRLELVSSFDCVRVSLWCLAVGKVVRSPTSLLSQILPPFSQILPPFSDCGTACGLRNDPGPDRLCGLK